MAGEQISQHDERTECGRGSKKESLSGGNPETLLPRPFSSDLVLDDVKQFIFSAGALAGALAFASPTSYFDLRLSLLTSFSLAIMSTRNRLLFPSFGRNSPHACIPLSL